MLRLDYLFSADRLRRRYRELVKQTHPDVGGDVREFMKVQTAYLELSKWIDV